MRTKVMINCTHCHGITVIVRGQKPMGHWAAVKLAHEEYVHGLPKAELDAIFDYLSENFNDTKPEPRLPEWFVQQDSIGNY
jgi:hypothetical protein